MILTGVDSIQVVQQAVFGSLAVSIAGGFERERGRTEWLHVVVSLAVAGTPWRG